MNKNERRRLAALLDTFRDVLDGDDEKEIEASGSKETSSEEDQEDGTQGEETSGEESGEQESTAPAAAKKTSGKPESANAADNGQSNTVEPVGSEADAANGEEDSEETSQKESFSQEEVSLIVQQGEKRGFSKDSVSSVFELIDRDKLVDEQGKLSDKKLNETLDFLESIVLRKKNPGKKKENYKYDPLDSASKGFEKYIKE